MTMEWTKDHYQSKAKETENFQLTMNKLSGKINKGRVVITCKEARQWVNMLTALNRSDKSKAMKRDISNASKWTTQK